MLLSPVTPNAPVNMPWRSHEGTISIGNECIMFFHPLLERNILPLAKVTDVEVSLAGLRECIP